MPKLSNTALAAIYEACLKQYTLTSDAALRDGTETLRREILTRLNPNQSVRQWLDRAKSPAP